MQKKILFIGGVHGVGKTTFCGNLSKALNLPHYSASALIKSHNALAVRDDTKGVASVSGNQDILLHAIAELSDKRIILDGHFVIPNLDAKLEVVPIDFFKKLPIELMILLTDDPEQIAKRTFSRDGRIRSSEDISSQQDMEKTHAKFVAKNISVDLLSVVPNHAGIEAVSKYL